MKRVPVFWWSTDFNVEFCEEHVVSFDEDVGILRRYIDDYDPPYENEEVPLAASHFNFSRSDADYMALDFHGSHQIAIKVERPGPLVPWFLRLFRGNPVREETVTSVDEAADRIRRYFVADPEIVLG